MGLGGPDRIEHPMHERRVHGRDRQRADEREGEALKRAKPVLPSVGTTPLRGTLLDVLPRHLREADPLQRGYAGSDHPGPALL
jgi:hypothetical protein